MNIRRFHAPTAREALALARDAFGDTALILSNRQLAQGVEVMAASEEALAELDSVAVAAAPRLAPAPVAAPAAAAAFGAAPVAAAPLKPNAALEAPPRETSVRADTEQLAMSTLSFQDYVRERMLRRQHEAKQAEAPQQQQQPAPVARPVAAPVAAPVPAPAQAFVPQPVVLSEPPPAMAQPVAQPVAEIAPEPLPVAPAVVIATPEPAAPAPALMAELQAMRQSMEERFTMLAWLGQAKQDVVQSNLMLALARAGFSPTLCRQVLEPLQNGAAPGTAVKSVLAALEKMLLVDPESPPLHEERGVIAMMGATGVGKTTGVAKIAAQCARAYGAASVGLITLDTHRAGAHEQLRAHGRTLGVVAHLAHDRPALQELLSLLGGKRLVLIDTAGVAPRDPGVRDLLAMLDQPTIRRVVVLNAGSHGDTLDDIATAFKAGGSHSACEAVISKVDETARLGPVLDVVMRHGLKLRGISAGQRVPDDWKAPDAADLVRAALRSTQRSAFEPRSADLGLYFSPEPAGNFF